MRWRGATVFGKPRCTYCKETKERVHTFATLEELQTYVAKPPAWG
jgi:arsenate reductase-like glutaredoxin family protein